MSPILANYIGVLLLGGLLGVLGQGVRTIVGLKKIADQAETQNVGQYDLFLAGRLFVSLFIGFIAGAAAAFFTINVSDQMQLTGNTLTGIAMAGYAGADFIEGIASRFTSSTSNTANSRIKKNLQTPPTEPSVGRIPRTVTPDIVQPRAPAPATFNQAVVDACSSFSLRNAADVNGVFAGRGGFFAWYNANLSTTSAFQHRGKAKNTALINQHFSQFWDHIPITFGVPDISMIEFCALMSVNIQETTGDLTAAPEEVNGQTGPHPGLAYAFDIIPGLKDSYNIAPNISCYALFKDFYFLKQHGDLAGSAVILNNPGGIDPAWAGQSWPASYQSTRPVAAINGFVMEADFYKFRGRGIIQTTWRSDYKYLISYILSSAATSNPTLSALANQWLSATQGLTGDAQLDAIATITTNDDWDQAFALPLLLATGVAIDNTHKGNYLTLSRNATVLQAAKSTPGSLLYMAGKINGGSYPTTVAPMMQAMMCAVASLAPSSVAAIQRQPRRLGA